MNRSASHRMEMGLSVGSPEYRLNCQLRYGSPSQRESQRLDVLTDLDLHDHSETGHWPVFEEAAQTAARMLATPLSVLSVVDRHEEYFKAAVGLSQLGLMNPLAKSRRLAHQESFGVHVVDSGQPLILDNTTTHPAFSQSLLVQQYGIRAYLGVPLTTSEGICVGTLAVFDTAPRQFTAQDVAVLELNARWSMSELERDRLSKNLNVQPAVSARSVSPSHDSTVSPSLESTLNSVRIALISQLTQDLRNPLTSIMGMASMLSREIYGPLTEKQREYTEIVRQSSQSLLSLADEIIELGVSNEDYRQLTVTPVDLEMLTQQALSNLEALANQQEQKLHLTIEPSSRIWSLDKSKVKQLLYHLVFSLVQMGSAGNTIRLHISRKDDRLNIAIWVANPWLGEGLPQAVISLHEQLGTKHHKQFTLPMEDRKTQSKAAYDWMLESAESEFLLPEPAGQPSPSMAASREELGILLSHQLVEVHGGQLQLQGSITSGYRYVIILPSMAQTNHDLQLIG
ncbi:MAG: GAF domain-containing sensor histidine kinase [Cyanobacteria bacterium J06639_16]